jgi:hypothetical protein
MQRDLLIALAVILAIAGICFGAVKAHPLTPPQPTPPVAVEGAPGTAPAVKPAGPVVMHVNGEPVTEAEFALFLQSLPEQYRQMVSNPAVRRELAEQFVRMKVLEQQAKKLGADQDPEVAAKMSFGHTNVLLEYALKKIGAQPPEAAMRAAYEKEKAQIPPVTSLAHIVIAYQGGQIPSRASQPLPPELAMQQAQLVIAKIKSGMPFEEAARQYSDDEGSAAQGGRIGDMQPGMLPPELQQVIDKMQPGAISAPIRSQLGIHIFRVLARHAPSFEELKPALTRRVQQDMVQAEVEKLQKTAKVELDPKYFPAAPATPAFGRPGAPGAPGTPMSTPPQPGR